ncbi:MAG: tRNA (adenosine(37)-N6)-dimethylallyltransferase MiaA [Candidatus Dormibacteria bacterium]
MLGPTASGKTAVAVALAARLGGEVISFDSRQVYRGIEISSNAPQPDESAGVVVHMIGRLDPEEDLTAARYVAMAREAAAGIAPGRPQLLTAGTGMYLKAYLDGLDLGGMGAVAGLREQLEDEARRDLPGLARRLQQLSPGLAASTDLQNPVRVVRRMELLWAAALAEDRTGTGAPATRMEAAKVGLRVSPALLQERIQARIERMLTAGWREEVQALLRRDPAPSPQVLRSIGVAEMAAHLRGEISEGGMRSTVLVRTRQYAKRQRTWFRADRAVAWIDAGNREVSDIVEHILEMLD